MAEPAQSQPSFSRIEVAPLTGALGAAITGADLSESLDDATFAEIERAFHENLVVVFPGQEISPADHLAFTR